MPGLLLGHPHRWGGGLDTDRPKQPRETAVALLKVPVGLATRWTSRGPPNVMSENCLICFAEIPSTQPGKSAILQ